MYIKKHDDILNRNKYYYISIKNRRICFREIVAGCNDWNSFREARSSYGGKVRGRGRKRKSHLKIGRVIEVMNELKVPVTHRGIELVMEKLFFEKLSKRKMNHIFGDYIDSKKTARNKNDFSFLDKIDEDYWELKREGFNIDSEHMEELKNEVLEAFKIKEILRLKMKREIEIKSIQEEHQTDDESFWKEVEKTTLAESKILIDTLDLSILEGKEPSEEPDSSNMESFDLF